MEKQEKKSNYKFEQVKGTAFTIIGNEEEGYIIVIGNNRTSEKTFSSIEDAKISIENKDWELINALVDIISKYNVKNQ